MNSDNNEKLSAEFTKSQSLESTLDTLNRLVAPLQVEQRDRPQMPLMLVMGAPRSGTTLFMQWLASLGVFGYPSNLVARFYRNPALGVLVQKALIDLDRGRQIGLGDAPQQFSSALGRTTGATAPSEFWYFWREYFRFSDTGMLSDGELQQVDVAGLLGKLGQMEAAIGKPLVMKGMILNWNIPFLSSICDRFFFVNVQRDTFSVAQSILESRVRYAGSRDAWWSFKPPQYREWLDLDAISQVAAQAVFTQRAVSEGLAGVDDDRKLSVDYEQFCRAPSEVYRAIREKYRRLGSELPEPAGDDTGFRATAEVRLDAADAGRLQDAIARWVNGA